VTSPRAVASSGTPERRYTYRQPPGAVAPRDEHRLRLTILGWALVVPVAFLLGTGIVAIRVTDRGADAALTAAADQRDEAHANETWISRAQAFIGERTLRQGMFILTGIGLMLAVMSISYRRLGEYTFVIYGGVMFLLALLVLDRYVDLPLIPVKRATRRWIELGAFSLQPSEFMKLALVLALARYLRFRKTYRRWSGLIPPFLMTLAPMLLILKQPDLGTLLMLLPVLFAMLFVAGARLRHLSTIVILGLATMPVFYFFGMKPYQRQRVQVLFRQNTEDERWHMDEGYQLRQGLTALGTGGLTGQGLGQGAFVRYGLLPEEHNDFIFAIIGNQWGMLGCIFVILAYVMIVLFGLEVAQITNDPFGRLLAIGVIVMIVMQAMLNMCMNTGLAPITGMTLPFVSYGGSSMWTNFLALGLLLNVAQRRPLLIANPPFEHGDDT